MLSQCEERRVLVTQKGGRLGRSGKTGYPVLSSSGEMALKAALCREEAALEGLKGKRKAPLSAVVGRFIAGTMGLRALTGWWEVKGHIVIGPLADRCGPHLSQEGSCPAAVGVPGDVDW